MLRAPPAPGDICWKSRSGSGHGPAHSCAAAARARPEPEKMDQVTDLSLVLRRSCGPRGERPGSATTASPSSATAERCSPWLRLPRSRLSPSCAALSSCLLEELAGESALLLQRVSCCKLVRQWDVLVDDNMLVYYVRSPLEKCCNAWSCMDSAWITCASSTAGRSKRFTNSTITCCWQQAVALFIRM